MEEIDRRIDLEAAGLTEHVRELVRLKSVAGTPEPGMPFGKDVFACLTRALEIAEELGFTIRNLDGYCGYAEYGSGEEYVGVLGHVDVVPEGGGWTYPPYGAAMQGNRIYGRGTMDDKGPLVAALYGLKAVKDAAVPLKRKVRIIIGTNEESGFCDMPHYLASEPAPVCGFTPDGEFPVIYSEKGLYFAEIEKKLRLSKIRYINGGHAPNIVPDRCKALVNLDCGKVSRRLEAFRQETGFCLYCGEAEGGTLIVSEGKAAHGSKPHLGANAIMQLFIFLSALPIEGEDADFVRFFADRLGMRTDGGALVPALKDETGDLTLNVGMAEIGSGAARITMDIRYPGKSAEGDIAGFLESGLKSLGVSVKKRLGMPPVYFAKDHFLIQTLMDVYEKATKRHDAPLAIGGGTYAKTLPNMAAFGPLLPGREDLNHKADEYIETGELLLLAKIYGNAIYELAK